MSKSVSYGTRRIVRDVLLLVVAVVCIVGSSTAGSMFGTGVSASTVVKRGVAVASECGFQGPFGPGSLGWWWTCEASVEWEDGTIERQRFLQSQLTSNDLNTPVDVEMRRVMLSEGKGSFEENFRADFVPNIFLGNLISVPLMAAGCLIIFWFVIRIARWIVRTRRTDTENPA